MLILLSPAKKLDFTVSMAGIALSEPIFAHEAQKLAQSFARRSALELQAMMGLSEKLARLNHERFQRFGSGDNVHGPAVMVFNGDTYSGLGAREIDPATYRWMTRHLRILSGLYGVLAPFDAIEPYRLEMGLKLGSAGGDGYGESLYEFWGERLSHALLDALQDHSEPVVLNLASNEYFKSVAKGLKKARIRIVEPRFLHDKKGVLNSPGFAAKRARGQMARFVLENQIEAPENCTAFAADGYRWNGELSTPNQPVFVKQAR